MPATTIHLVRHGEVYNPDHVLYERLPNFHLSDRGVRMAQATARYIAAHSGINQASAVYSSPLDRTRETAGEILAALNSVRTERDEPTLELHTDKRVIEAGSEFRGKRIGHGDGALWRPENLKLIRNLHKPTWGESYAHIGARMSDFVYEKVDEYAGRQVIVVSHESPIWSFRHLMETGHAEHWMFLRKTALASVTSFTFDADTHELIAIAYADPAANVR
ncbi:histidine phosphatase family protein [Bifidobacterium sp. SMB2]|uniref:Histidine phosphatase family protein n=1 Tax=Bifidobacterium saimiriisciurei TaxID=2661627 RepID=A0ABX0CC54_9BIFI|nr:MULTISPECIES: histidine phosphatase family protein [Bifidobacterium]NEG96243.1 histidine phosphatase family protein [Bifidobacterium sp. SMB2]NEH12256.1 histidine phosphatase family protein [Bifidobacterium saimiriisciurei]